MGPWLKPNEGLRMDNLWLCFLWGLFGGLLIDGLEFWKAVRANNGEWPPDMITVGANLLQTPKARPAVF